MDGDDADDLIGLFGDRGVGLVCLAFEIGAHPTNKAAQTGARSHKRVGARLVEDLEDVCCALLAVVVKKGSFDQPQPVDYETHQGDECALVPFMCEFAQGAEGGRHATRGFLLHAKVVEPRALSVENEIIVGTGEGFGAQGGDDGRLVRGVVDGTQDGRQVADLLALEEGAAANVEVRDAGARACILVHPQVGAAGDQYGDICECGRPEAVVVVADLPHTTVDVGTDQRGDGIGLGGS